MLPDDLKSRLGRVFENQTTRRALLLGGSLFAAWSLGFASADLIETIRLGVVYAIQHVPLLDAAYTAKTWFAGAMSQVASVGLGLSDWATGSGIEVGRQARDALLSMQAFMGDTVHAAKEMFHGTLSQTREFASFWMIKTGIQIPADPVEATIAIGKGVGKALLGIAEIWGVYEAAKKAYDWTLKKVKGNSETETDKTKSGDGVQIGSVQNLQLTIAIGGQPAAETAKAQLEAAMRASDIIIPDTVIAKAVEAVEQSVPAGKAEEGVLTKADLIVETSQTAETPVNRKAWDGLLKESPWPLGLSASKILWASQEFQKTLNGNLAESLASSTFPALANLSEEVRNRPLELIGDILVMSQRRRGPNDSVFVDEDEDAPVVPRDSEHPPSPPLM